MQTEGVYANPEPPATERQAHRLEKCDPPTTTGLKMRDFLQRLSGPASKSLANPSKNIKHPPAKPVDVHMRAKPSVLRGHVKRVIRSASRVETVTCCP